MGGSRAPGAHLCHSLQLGPTFLPLPTQPKWSHPPPGRKNQWESESHPSVSSRALCPER